MINYQRFAAYGAAVVLGMYLSACNTVAYVPTTKEELFQQISDPTSQSSSVSQSDAGTSGPAEDEVLRRKAEKILNEFLEKNEKDGETYLLSPAEWSDLVETLDLSFDTVAGVSEKPDGRRVLAPGSYDDMLTQLGRHTGFGSASRTVDGVAYTVFVFRVRS